MAAAKFSMVVDQVGASKLEINGVDVLHEYRLTAAQVTAFVNQPTVLALTAAATSGTIEGEGIVHIHHSGPDIVALLDRMNPRAVEEEALSRMSWGDGRAIVDIVLEIVREKVSEAQSQASGTDDQQPDGG
jgi:hypothetical protein